MVDRSPTTHKLPPQVKETTQPLLRQRRHLRLQVNPETDGAASAEAPSPPQSACWLQILQSGTWVERVGPKSKVRVRKLAPSACVTLAHAMGQHV
eukprot:6212670-Pleurochrysis_carterae.AAC.1